MTITDPEVIKRVQEGLAKKKAEREANKGKPEKHTVLVTFCHACKSSHGTFKWVIVRTKDGKLAKALVHVNCPARGK
jgi:ribosomal protein L44E